MGEMLAMTLKKHCRITMKTDCCNLTGMDRDPGKESIHLSLNLSNTFEPDQPTISFSGVVIL